MRQQHAGFTLIELLISIAIIGTLSATLMPNLLGARARAQDTVTVTFLRQAALEQELHHMYYSTYAATVAELGGTAALPPSVSIVSESGDPSSFCIVAKYATANSRTFNVTPGGSVTEGTCS